MGEAIEEPDDDDGVGNDSTVLGIYFTDFFMVGTDVLEAYGAFNVSLVNDLPLFIDPFLLFDSDKPAYRQLHSQYITYVKFLRDLSVREDGLDQTHIDQWFRFPEVKENWLGLQGFSRRGR